MSPLLAQVNRPGSDHGALAKTVLTDPALVKEMLAGLESDTVRVKYGCAKIVRLVSERQPELLYPHFDFFVRLLDHKNKILQWEAAFVLSHLARVDAEDKFDAVFAKYFAPVPGPVMITAANVIRGAAQVAIAKPQWADRIAREVLKVSRARYQTAECRNVAIGHAIEALSRFYDSLGEPGPVVRFVTRQLANTRNATRKKAARFLKKINSGEKAAVTLARGTV